MATRQLAPVLRYIRRVSGAPADDSDRALLQRFARHGDAEAFAGVVRRHGPMVLAVCRRVLRDGHDADDAFQAVFLLLVRKAGSLRRPEQLGPWLHGVAHRVAVKARSLGLRRRGREEPLADLPAPPSADDPVWRDLRPVLDDAVRSLPAKYRGPFVLCYLQGMTHAEAARHLGCPPGTIATRLSRARDQLRARLVRRGVTLSAGALAVVLATRAEASVPPALFATALRTIAVPSAVPSHVTALTEGVCRMMLLQKMRFVAMALVAAAAVGALVVGYRSGAAEPPTAPPPSPPAAPAATEAPADKAEAATVRTKNFEVTAPTARIARLLAEAAERQRKEQALLWLGKELPAWSAPCPVRVTINAEGSGGATTFTYGPDAVEKRDKVEKRDMHLEGSLDKLLASVLPHEVTHTVLADYFGAPVPRWADEGGAVLAEDEQEQQRHARLAREMADQGRLIPLSRLLALREYPDDVMALYVSGYALTRFLVERKDRPTFLAFAKQGKAGDWAAAVKEHYGLHDLSELERQWTESLKKRAADVVAPGMPMARTGLPEEGPLAGLARLRPDGKGLLLDVIHTKVSYRLGLVRSADGVNTPELMPSVTHRLIKVRMPLSEVKAYRADGKPVDPTKLAELLKEEVAVLVAPERSAVHPYFLQLAKEDTLIIVVKPAELAEATGAAPQAVTPPSRPAPPASGR
jgi:RNA polymerase sigma factor (sigma-70 family)